MPHEPMTESHFRMFAVHSAIRDFFNPPKRWVAEAGVKAGIEAVNEVRQRISLDTWQGRSDFLKALEALDASRIAAGLAGDGGGDG